MRIFKPYIYIYEIYIGPIIKDIDSDLGRGDMLSSLKIIYTKLRQPSQKNYTNSTR